MKGIVIASFPGAQLEPFHFRTWSIDGEELDIVLPLILLTVGLGKLPLKSPPADPPGGKFTLPASFSWVTAPLTNLFVVILLSSTVFAFKL